jgi:hypothetical protein
VVVPVVPPPHLLLKTQPPARIPANVGFTVVAELVNSSGNVITSFNGPVTISLAGGPPGNNHLSGTLTVKAVKGVATFPLKLDKVGDGYRLKISVGTLSTLTEPFDVVAKPF